MLMRDERSEKCVRMKNKNTTARLAHSCTPKDKDKTLCAVLMCSCRP